MVITGLIARVIPELRDNRIRLLAPILILLLSVLALARERKTQELVGCDSPELESQM
jgi:hypothetical protein